MLFTSRYAYAALYECIAVVWLAVTRPDMLRPDRLGHHDLDEPRVVVVGLVAVDVDPQPVLLGQRERETHRLDAVLAGELVVRDAADDVGAELDGLAHELATAVERKDAELRKRDELQVDLAARLLSKLDQRT